MGHSGVGAFSAYPPGLSTVLNVMAWRTALALPGPAARCPHAETAFERRQPLRH